MQTAFLNISVQKFFRDFSTFSRKLNDTLMVFLLSLRLHLLNSQLAHLWLRFLIKMVHNFSSCEHLFCHTAIMTTCYAYVFMNTVESLFSIRVVIRFDNDNFWPFAWYQLRWLFFSYYYISTLMFRLILSTCQFVILDFFFTKLFKTGL